MRKGRDTGRKAYSLLSSIFQTCPAPYLFLSARCGWEAGVGFDRERRVWPSSGRDWRWPLAAGLNQSAALAVRNL